LRSEDHRHLRVVETGAQHEVESVEQSQMGRGDQQIWRPIRQALPGGLECGRADDVVACLAQRLDEPCEDKRMLVNDEHGVRHTRACHWSNSIAILSMCKVATLSPAM
jgi:hypothetical protein